VATAFRKLGSEVCVTSKPSEIEKATRLVLPGVGSLDDAMQGLAQSGAKAAIERQVREARVPTLGICLGLQMFTRSSEEGQSPGFG
jgi:glutamine amidotransferase